MEDSKNNRNQSKTKSADNQEPIMLTPIAVKQPANQNGQYIKETKNNKGNPHVYKNMKMRKLNLASGFILTLLAFLMVLTALLILFVPAFNFKSPTTTPLIVNTYLYGFGTGTAFLGIILSVCGANTSKALARLSFLLGILAFIVGLTMFIICLLCKSILPINAINNIMENCFSLII